jgi:peroxiredoxin Q/BCP
VGDVAPDFTLPTATGGEVTLSQFRGARPVVLVFYRAFW